MLHGCMLEYLKGKTHEQEKKGCPLLATRGLFSFIDPLIIFFNFILLKERHYGYPTRFQMCNHYVTTSGSIIVVKYCTQ